MTGPRFDPLVVGALVLAALAGVGVLVSFGAGARAAHRATRHAREVTRMGATLTRALLAGAVIAGVRWAVVASTTAPPAWGVALGVPAVLAGSTVARMLTMTEIVGRRGHGRGAR